MSTTYRRRDAAGVAAIVVAGLAGAVVGAAVMALGVWATLDDSHQARLMPASSPPPSVVELMAAAGCEGGLIEPQLYAREVGRCAVGGQEVTVASFADADSRDAWAEASEALGLAVVRGDRWAVAGAGAAGPEAFAAALR